MINFIDIIKNTNRTPIFVDLNNMLYRSYYVFTPDKFRTKNGVPNGHLFGLAQILRTMHKLNYEIFLCEDSPCDWRKQLNEDYKSNRNPSENGTEFWRDYPKIRDLISNLSNCWSLSSDGYEADDIMFSGAKICSQLGIKCCIFSSDKDLMQALDENIKIVHKVTLTGNEEVLYNSDYYNEKFPVEPKKLPYYRAFKGDVSDNIEPPVKRFPKDLIIDVVNHLYEEGTMQNYKIKKESHKKWLKQLCENWNVYLNNVRLMKLSIIDFQVLDKSSLDSYKNVCQYYELYQFQKYINELA